MCILVGRATKNPDHVLVRLRAALSTPGVETFTREKLAHLARISASTIREIETGGFQLTEDMAIKIGFATGADPQSLLVGNLLDFRKQPFSKETQKLREPYPWPEELRESMRQLLSAAFDASQENKITLLFAFTFETWLSATLKTLRLEDAFSEKLSERIASLDPALIDPVFRPKEGPSADTWAQFEAEVQKEWIDLCSQARAESPNYWFRFDTLKFSPSPTVADKALIQDCQKRIDSLRKDALEVVARRWKEVAPKAAAPKPVSGKRPRSPGRPPA
jgi:hypothetical protein